MRSGCVVWNPLPDQLVSEQTLCDVCSTEPDRQRPACRQSLGARAQAENIEYPENDQNSECIVSTLMMRWKTSSAVPWPSTLESTRLWRHNIRPRVLSVPYRSAGGYGRPLQRRHCGVPLRRGRQSVAPPGRRPGRCATPLTMGRPWRSSISSSALAWVILRG